MHVSVIRRWLCRIIFLLAIVVPTGQLPAPTFPDQARRVAVLGDSITYSGQYVVYLEAFARRYWPSRHLEFINVGLPSETVSGLSEPGHANGDFPRPDLHERLDRILQQLQPDLVLACYGMNCGIYHPYDSQRFAAWQDGMQQLHRQVIQSGADIVHLTPPPFDPHPIRDRTLPAGQQQYLQPYEGYNEVLALYSAWLAAQRGLGWNVVDIHTPMTRFLEDQRQEDPSFLLAGDGVHLNDQGHWLIAKSLIRFWNAPSEAWQANSPDQMLDPLPNPKDAMRLIQQRQRLVSDFWLNQIGHLRPGMNPGLSRPETERQREDLDQRIAGHFAGLHPDSKETPARAASRGGRTNVVVVLADDLGYGDLQAYQPDSRIPTPNLNRLAAEGMRFTDAHSGSSVCTPTRYGLLTGRYCWRTSLKHGVLGGYSPPLLEPQRPTLAGRLQHHGYRTAAIGKWHLGMQMPLLQPDADRSRWEGDIGVDFQGIIRQGPTEYGFDRYFGVSASLDMAPYVYIRDDRFQQPPTLQQSALPFPHFIRSGPRSKEFIIDEVLDALTREAVAFLQEAAAQPKPFFLYFPLTAPHKPTQPHPRFRGKTRLSEYGDFVAQVDWTVGQILEVLDQSGTAQETLILFTSDNGSYMYAFDDAREDHLDRPSVQGFRRENHRANAHWRGTKADIWEAGHRVPFLVRWPARVQAGTTCGTTICLTDIYATVMDILELDLDVAEAEDSFSFYPQLLGSPEPRPAPVVHHSVQGMFAIREGPLKLVAGNGSGGREQPRGRPFAEPYQLFNLEEDPSESNDLASDHPQIVQRLVQRLQEIRSGGRSRP